MRLAWLLALALLGSLALTGCDDGGDGDGDADADADADADGDGDADADGDGDADEVVVTYTTEDVHVYENDGEGGKGDPIEGAHIAVDGYSGRREYRTDATGTAQVEIEEDGGSFTITMAADGRTPVSTLLDLTFDDVARLQAEDDDGELAFLVYGAATGTWFEVEIDATGVAEGHRFCAGGAPGSWQCADGDGTVTLSRYDEGEPMTVTGYTVDETGRPVEFVEVDLTGIGESRSVTLEFDGVSEIEPATMSVTLVLPEDSQSYFHVHGVHADNGLPFFALDPSTYLVRGGAHGVEPSIDGGAIDMSVTYFPLADGEVAWGFNAYAAEPSAQGWPWSNRTFLDPIEDGGIYEIMDIPRIPDARNLEDLGCRIETQEIVDAALYALVLHDLDYTRTLWHITSANGPVFRVPRLPSGLPPQDGWPAPRALMSAELLAFDAWFPEEDPSWPGIEAWRRSRSPAFVLAFDWCEPECDGRSCGDDGCGWTCAPGCGDGERCEEATGECVVCEPECDGRACGDDGCGGTCDPGCDGTDVCSEAAGSCVGAAGGFVDIPAGTFMMGSPEDEVGRDPTVETQHEVTLTRGFMLHSTEVTQGEFEALMGYNPSEHPECGADCPVSDVSWNEAAAYCNAMSAAESLAECYECTGTGSDSACDLAAAYATAYDCPGYRLPTEAEWEYAARAGTTTATYAGDLSEDGDPCGENPVLDPIAWWCHNAGDEPHPVGGLDPNGWGLFDMLGSSGEWCHDRYTRGDDYAPDPVTDPVGDADGVRRIIRSGSYGIFTNAYTHRSARRGADVRSSYNDTLGFRVARTSP